MKDQELEQLLRGELKNLVSNLIWHNDQGEYEVFGKYRIVREKNSYKVWAHATCVGVFNSTKTALSWCVADKYCNYNLARRLLTIDNCLGHLNNDIFVRAAIANKVRRVQTREDIETKLETKIIQKKQLEQQLADCVDLAKYLQQRGFENETARSSRTGTNKTSR